MKKEYSPELYNYNKYPGPTFLRFEDKVVAESIELTLLANHKEAFDHVVFGQRFSPLMLKYDFIVGDWGNDQLRLKGFYTEEKNVKPHFKITHLDDYLTEFCSFGCAYFVLFNPQPQIFSQDEKEERSERSKRKRNRGRKGSRPQFSNEKSDRKKEKQRKRVRKEQNREIQDAKRGFVIRQR